MRRQVPHTTPPHNRTARWPSSLPSHRAARPRALTVMRGAQARSRCCSFTSRKRAWRSAAAGFRRLWPKHSCRSIFRILAGEGALVRPHEMARQRGAAIADHCVLPVVCV